MNYQRKSFQSNCSAHVYLAGPISHVSYDEANAWRDRAAFKLHPERIGTISPLRGKQIFIGHAQEGEVEDLAADAGITPRQIVTRDMMDISRSDLILANMLDVKRDNKIMVGTPMEIFFAAHNLNLPVVLVANDIRSPWLDHFCMRVFQEMDPALDFIIQWFHLNR